MAQYTDIYLVESHVTSYKAHFLKMQTSSLANVLSVFVPILDTNLLLCHSHEYILSLSETSLLKMRLIRL